MPSEQDFKARFDGDPEFKSHFLTLDPEDQGRVIEAYRTAPLTAIGIPVTNRRRVEGLQPQKGETPPPTTWEDSALNAVNGATTTAAAGAMLPAGLAAAGLGRTVGIPALRALGVGGVTGGVDAAMGGDHPIRAGAVGALGELGIEIPGVRKLLGSALNSILGRGEAQAAEVAPSLLKKQLMKYGGPTDPGYSLPSGPASVKINPEVQVPWEPKKVNYRKATGTDQPSGPSYSNPTKKEIKVPKTRAEILKELGIR